MQPSSANHSRSKHRTGQRVLLLTVKFLALKKLFFPRKQYFPRFFCLLFTFILYSFSVETLHENFDFESPIMVLATFQLCQFTKYNIFMLIFGQKSLQFWIPSWENWQPILPYYLQLIFLLTVLPSIHFFHNSFSSLEWWSNKLDGLAAWLYCSEKAWRDLLYTRKDNKELLTLHTLHWTS